MRNRDGKRITYRFLNFRYTECDAFAEYLHGMSLKGWHFKGWKYGMVFEKGEPADAEYDVEVFTQSRETDLRPENEAQEYAEYCQAAGWEFVDGNRRFCVFRRAPEDAAPIVTEEERFQEVWKAERRVVFGGTAAFLAVTVFLWFFIRDSWLYWMFNGFTFLVGICFPVFTAGYLLQSIALQVWYMRGKKCLRDGERIRYSLRIGYRIENLMLGLTLAAVLIWAILEGYYKICLSGLLAFLVFWGFRAAESFFRLSREGRVRADVIACAAYIILYTALNVLYPYDNVYTERTASLFGSAERGEAVVADGEVIIGEEAERMVRAGKEGLSYEFYRSDYPWVMDLVWNELKEPRNPGWESEETKQVYYYIGTRSFRYEDAVLMLTYREKEPGEEEAHLILEKLL